MGITFIYEERLLILFDFRSLLQKDCRKEDIERNTFRLVTTFPRENPMNTYFNRNNK